MPQLSQTVIIHVLNHVKNTHGLKILCFSAVCEVETNRKLCFSSLVKLGSKAIFKKLLSERLAVFENVVMRLVDNNSLVRTFSRLYKYPTSRPLSFLQLTRFEVTSSPRGIQNVQKLRLIKYCSKKQQHFTNVRRS